MAVLIEQNGTEDETNQQSSVGLVHKLSPEGKGLRILTNLLQPTYNGDDWSDFDAHSDWDRDY